LTGTMREQDEPGDPGMPPMRSQDYSEVEDWPGYFASVLGKGARETLLEALAAFTREGFGRGLGVLLEGFEIESMNEEEKDDPPGLRSPKHWHLFHVVAKKQ